MALIVLIHNFKVAPFFLVAIPQTMQLNSFELSALWFYCVDGCQKDFTCITSYLNPVKEEMVIDNNKVPTH